MASETYDANGDGGYSIYLGATQTSATLTQQKTVNTDGTYDIHYYGITGKSYTDYDIVYGANGKPTSEAWSNGQTETWSYNADASLHEEVVNGISGQKWTSTDTIYGSNGKPASETWLNGTTLFQTETWNSDGSVNDIHTYAAGTFDGVSYASYDKAYTAGVLTQETYYDPSGTVVVASETYDANGDGGYSIYLGATQTSATLTQQKTVNTDGTYDIHYYGITGKSYTDYDIVYGANGKPTSEAWSNGQTETWSYNADASLHEEVVNGISGQKWTSTDTIYGSNGKPASETWLNGTTLLQTETWNSDGSVNDIHTYAAGTFDGVSYASYDKAYTAGVLTQETYYDPSGTVVVASETYDANGDGGYSIYLGATQTSATLTQQKTVNTDGTYDIHYYGITGKSYTDYDIVYGANGKPTSEAWSNGQTETWSYNADASLHEEVVNGISGQKWTSTDTIYGSNGKPASETWLNGTTLFQTETWNSDGSVNDIHTYAAGTFDGVSYASYDKAYTAGVLTQETYYDPSGTVVVASETYDANGDGGYSIYLGATQTSATLTQQKTVNTDGTYDIAYTNVTGQSYSSYENIYNAAGTLVAKAVDNTNGPSSLTLYGNGLTVTLSPTQNGVTTGTDTFALNPHLTEKITATGTTNQTFVFTPGFGNDTITGFDANTDILQFSASSFGLPSGSGWTQVLNNHNVVQSGGNVLITDTSSAHDTVTLIGVNITALTSANVHFV